MRILSRINKAMDQELDRIENSRPDDPRQVHWNACKSLRDLAWAKVLVLEAEERLLNLEHRGVNID